MPVSKPNPEELKKLAEGYRFVTIPAYDPYDYVFDGIHIAGGHYKPVKDGPVMDKPPDPGFDLHLKPGRHLLSPELADEVEGILKRWSEEMLRMTSRTPRLGRVSAQQALNLGTGANAGTKLLEEK
jgi:hypothetical protein